MITLLILLVMAFTQTKQENSHEVNEVMSKYIKNLNDIEAKYVMQPMLARMVTRLLNGTMNIFPLMKLSMNIDRTPVKIPWEIGESAKSGEKTYKLIKPRNKRKKKKIKSTSKSPTPRPRAKDDDVKQSHKENEGTTAKVAEDDKKGSRHINEDHLTQSHEEREANKLTRTTAHKLRIDQPTPRSHDDNFKQSHEGKEGIVTKITVIDKEKITTTANDEKETQTADPTTHKPSRRNRRRPVSDEEK